MLELFQGKDEYINSICTDESAIQFIYSSLAFRHSFNSSLFNYLYYKHLLAYNVRKNRFRSTHN